MMMRLSISKIVRVLLMVLWIACYPGTANLSIAAAPAEEAPPFVTITRIDSTQFPQVTAYVTVMGQNGEPVYDLTAKDFRLTEDDADIASTDVHVSPDDTLSFSMVLAIDISTFEPETLGKVQTAVKQLVSRLGPRDELAILAFHNEIDTIVPRFTNDTQMLNAAVEGLKATGNRTALNQAILTAAEQAHTAHRGVAVIITNKPDNTGTVSAKDLLEQIQQTGVPIYTICYGETQSSHLPSVASLSYGKHYDISSPDEVESSLLSVEHLLRQGYHIAFDSTLPADDEEHQLIVAHRKETEQASNHFLAQSGKVIVEVSGLEDNQRIALGDDVELSAKVTSPGKSAAVSYAIDDQIYAQQAIPSGAAPSNTKAVQLNTSKLGTGKYLLSIQASDNAGNTQAEQIPFEIVDPIIIEDFTVPSAVRLGEPITASVKIDALDGIDAIEFMLDEKDTGIATLMGDQYTHHFDSQNYYSGTHTISAYVRDQQGREKWLGVRAVSIAGPPPQPPDAPSFAGWLLALLIILALGLLAALILLLIFVIDIQKKRYRASYPLEIANLGNVTNHYELSAKETSGHLRFEFLHNGLHLAKQQEPAHAPIPVTQVNTMQQPRQSSQATPPASGSGDIQQKMRQTKQKARALSSFLNAISALLPFTRKLFAPVSGTLRKGEQSITKAERTTRRVDQTKDLVGDPLGEKTTSATAPSEAVLKTTPAPDTGSQPQPATMRVATASATATSAPAWVSTPDIEPGDTLKLNLQIQLPNGFVELDPKRAKSRKRQPEVYSFEVYSRPSEHPQETKTLKQDLQLVRMAWYRRLYPWIAFLMVAATTATFFVILLRNLGI